MNHPLQDGDDKGEAPLKKQIHRCFSVICEGPGEGLRTQEHLFSRFLFVSGSGHYFKGKKTFLHHLNKRL